jgi:NAD(P)H-quinone oxidoreductase subunit 5
MDTLSTLTLLAIPTLPLAVGTVLLLGRPALPTATRWAVRGAVLTLAAGLALLPHLVGGPVAAALTLPGGGSLGLVADRLGVVLVLLTATVGLIVQAFAARAMRDDPAGTRFLALASLLTATNLLVAVAGSLALLTAAWVATSVVVVALVGLRADRRAGARAAGQTRRCLMVGDLALVAGLGLTAATVGALPLPATAAAADVVGHASLPLPGGEVPVLPIVAILLMTAGVARSALVPLHRWLPSTLAAPTPVSALLHAGVINGAGVLLLRTAPVVGASRVAMTLLFVVGVATALLATAVMLVRSDVKGALAWSTAGQMGFMVVQVAVGAFAAALFHLVGHGLYKAASFLGAGEAISAHRAARHLPRTSPVCARRTRLLAATLVPLAALGLALVLVRPTLDPAKLLLVLVFGGWTASRLVHGALRATPTWRTLALAAPAATLATIAYVAVIAAVDGFLAPVLPAAVPGAVGPVTLGLTIALLALALAAVRLLPGAAGDRLRRRVYAGLVATSTPPIVAGRPASVRRRTPVPTPASPSAPPTQPTLEVAP